MPFKFNTLAYANKLVETGMPRAQAETQALALHEALSEGTVSPGELLILKTELTTRVDAVKHELIARIDAVKHELIARIDAVKHELIARIDVVKTELTTHVDAVRHDVDVLKRKVNALFWVIGLVLVLQVGQIGTMIYIIGRLP